MHLQPHQSQLRHTPIPQWMLVTVTRGHHFVLMSGGVRIGAIASFQLEAQQLCTGQYLHHGEMHTVS